MSIGITTSIKSYLPPKLRKRLKSTSSSKSIHPDDHDEKSRPEDPIIVAPPSSSKQCETYYHTNPQPQSALLHRLPLEIRKLIYSHVWAAFPQECHIYLQRGRLVHYPCVMHHLDRDDADFIQKQMDRIYRQSGGQMPRSGLGQEKLGMWQRRLASTWGPRHWRCEEAFVDGPRPLRGRARFELMFVCKRMYPEVSESIFESHTFLLNDLGSAHKFLVSQPSPFLPLARHLDLTLNLPFYEYLPFASNDASLWLRSRLRAVEKALCHIRRIHTLRVSFDVCDRKCWRRLPERRVTAALGGIRVATSFVVEMPAKLPIKVPGGNMDHLDEEEGDDGGVSFEVVRRPVLRYWMVQPQVVERLTWQVIPGASFCWLKSDTFPYLPNPYLGDLGTL